MEAGVSGEVAEEPSTARAGARLPSLATLLETQGGAQQTPPPASAAGGAGTRRSGAGSKPAKVDQWKGRHAVLDAINELLEELDGMLQLICDQALEHVHSNEVRLPRPSGAGCARLSLAFSAGYSHVRLFAHRAPLPT